MQLINTSELTPSLIMKWAASLLLPVLLYFLLSTFGDPATLKPEMIMFLCVTLWAVCAWAMGTMNDTAVALLLPIFYVLFCGVKQRVVFSPWLGDVAIIVIGGFVLGKIMAVTGLGKRIALACVRATGGSFVGAMVGIAIGAAIIAPLVPSIMGKAAIFTAIAIALCDTLQLKPKGKEATAVLLATCVAVGSTKLCYLTGAGDLVMGMALVDKVLNTQTMWLEYSLYNFLPGMLYLALSVAIILVALRVRIPKEFISATVKETYATLGPMTDEQKRALLLLVLTIVLLATDRFHGIPAGSVLIVITGIAFLPGVGLMDAKRLSTINFAPLFFVMGCMSIGAAGQALKATDWLANLVLPMLNGLSSSMVGFASYWVGVGLNFLLTPLAATSAFSTPITQLGVALGIEPRTLYFAFQYGLDNIIFPYEYALYLYFYSSGYVSFKLMAFVLALRMVLTGFFVAFVAVPWWNFILG